MLLFIFKKRVPQHFFNFIRLCFRDNSSSSKFMRETNSQALDEDTNHGLIETSGRGQRLSMPPCKLTLNTIILLIEPIAASVPKILFTSCVRP